jgi:DNA-binding transcriptional LysR family regulator
LSGDFLPQVIGKMLQEHSRVRIKVMSAGSLNVPAAVINGDVDLGMAFSLPRNAELHQLAVGRFHLGAVVTPDHPLAARKRVRIADCADFPLIMSDAQLSIRTLMHPIIVHSGRAILPTIEANSIELMKNLAERNLGIAFMSRIGLEKEIRYGTLVHVPLEDRGPVFTELGLYMRANASLPVAVDAFVQIAIAEIQRRAKEEE